MKHFLKWTVGWLVLLLAFLMLNCPDEPDYWVWLSQEHKTFCAVSGTDVEC